MVTKKEEMTQLTAKNITKIKNITNGETGKAYLDIQEKEFILHYPDNRKNGITETGTDELIVLYQRASKGEPRFLTHLVRPIDKERIEQSERENFRFGHIVEVIAFTGEENKIPFDKTLLSKLDFRNHGWGNAENLTKLNLKEDLEKYQIEIWELFKPFFNPDLAENLKDYQQYLNDELDKDFETKEGKLLFRNHRIRERDSSISHKKKMIALAEGKYKCEVCDFSYQDFYGQDYIECHHKIPISMGERITKLDDLALVCSNCHRMLHRKINDEYLSINKLKELIKK